MPRLAKPARLWLRPAEGDRGAVWCIVDQGRRISTNCGEGAREAAERALAEYIAAKHDPAAKRARHPSQVPIADVLSVYLDEVAPKQARPAQAAARVERLLEFWKTRRLDAVTPTTCRDYVEHRKGKGGSRRDLEDLRAAINHHARRDLHTGIIEVDLPPKGAPRVTWLTRSDVARLLWVCWRHGRTVRLPRGRERGKVVESEWHDLRHVARFILMGVYTGSRSGAIFSASIHAGANKSFVDLDSGIFYRLADGAAVTNKRQPPAPIPGRLLAHLRRWKEKGVIASHVVEWEGKPVASIKVAWARAMSLAKLGKKASPHTLRHTAATWLMQNGTDTWEAAGYLGMSEQTLREVYGHHHPDFMREAATRITQKRRRRT